MPFRLSIIAACGAALVATLLATSAFVMADRAQSDLTQAYARPVGSDTDAATLESDPVWRLGQRLFFDTRLSASSTISCASCHQPDQSWSDHLPKAIGDAHKPLAFRAPTLLNAGAIERYGWTGRFPDIETVAFFAMSSPANMNVPTSTLLGRLAAEPTYVDAFRVAFSDSAVSQHNVGTALTRYIRSIASDTAPFDRWVAGDRTALNSSAARGFAIFNGKGRCGECHAGWAFTDGSFHDIGIATGDDLGRGKLFKSSVKLQYAFKTPTLRNIAERAPYMHDGSITSLDAVVDHYNKGGIDRPSRAEAVRPLRLSSAEKDDLVAFLRTLTSGTKFVLRRDE